MIKLSTNTANQPCIMTLKESAEFYQVAFTHYLLILINANSENTSLAQIPTVLVDNERYTKLSVTTVSLTLDGRYNYYVYGQNSDTNLDPNDASVVGLCEQGILELNNDNNFFDTPLVTTPDTIVYEP